MIMHSITEELEAAGRRVGEAEFAHHQEEILHPNWMVRIQQAAATAPGWFLLAGLGLGAACGAGLGALLPRRRAVKSRRRRR